MENSILSCLCNIPVISSAVCHVEKIYQRNKERNGLTHVAFSAAELGLRTVLSVTQPIINQLQEPMNALSNLASEHLLQLQQSYPFIQTPTYEIFSAARLTLNEILNLSDDSETLKQNEEKNCEADSALSVATSTEFKETDSTCGLRALSNRFVLMLTTADFALMCFLHQYLFRRGNMSQNNRDISLVSTLNKVRNLVLCCSSCTPGWSFSFQTSGCDVSCITCGVNRHLLKILKNNLIPQVGSQTKYLNGLILQILDWLINHSPLRLLTPELQFGCCRFEDDGDPSVNGIDGNGGNQIYGYVPVHPLDIVNILLHANHGRSFWKRMHS